MAITELGGGDGLRGPEDPTPREYPIPAEGEEGQLIKTLAAMQMNQLKYGNPLGPNNSGQGLPGGLDPGWLAKVGKFFAKLFGIGGGGPSNAAEASIKAAVDKVATINGALGGTTSGASTVLGAIDKFSPLIKTGAAIADAFTQNRANNKDRALVGANMQANEVSNAESAQQSRARLVLEQQQSERAAQSDAYAKALQGALGRYGQDVTIDRPDGIPNISFKNSPRPSSIGDTGRANAAALEALATRQLTNPEARTVLPPLERVAIPGAVVSTGTLVPPPVNLGAQPPGRGRLTPLPLTPEEQAILDAQSRGRA